MVSNYSVSTSSAYKCEKTLKIFILILRGPASLVTTKNWNLLIPHVRDEFFANGFLFSFVFRKIPRKEIFSDAFHLLTPLTNLLCLHSHQIIQPCNRHENLENKFLSIKLKFPDTYLKYEYILSWEQNVDKQLTNLN